jgi:hypothetical protein
MHHAPEPPVPLLVPGAAVPPSQSPYFLPPMMAQFLARQTEEKRRRAQTERRIATLTRQQHQRA